MIHRHSVLMAMYVVMTALILIDGFTGGLLAGDEELPPPAERAERVRPIHEGQRIPDGEILTPEGTPVRLYDLIQGQPTILIFYRGGWCVYCNRQLSGLVKVQDKLLTLGYRIIAISADRPEKLKETLSKVKMKYELYSDAPMRLARQFGLAFRVDDETLKRYQSFGIDLEEASGYKHHILPVPAVYVVDTRGVVHFLYYNPDYRVRLDTQKLLDVATKLVTDLKPAHSVGEQ